MIYAENLEENVMKQWETAIAQPYVLQSALMADAHLGYTMPIGGVCLTSGVVVPSWVGYDIGCGVSTVKLSISAEDVSICSEAIVEEILRLVPVGFNKRKHRVGADTALRNLFSREGQKIWDAKGGSRHLGTLGSGNHFIEIGSNDKNGTVYLTVHSGSRGVGHGIATHYIKAAHPEGKCKEGSFPLDVTSDIGKAYINDQHQSLLFAQDNRLAISGAVIEAIAEVTGEEIIADMNTYINRTHNHVKYREGNWIHRKGATVANKGTMGVIPGNMRDGVYIVCGLGNPKSLCSASHGAGRAYGRKAAHRELSLEKFQEDMVGVTCQATKSRLDEAPDAYKNFDRVMELQSDLIEVVAHVTPIINVKG